MKKILKIAIIIDAWEPILGGGQIHVTNICKILIEKYNCKIDLFVRSIQDDDGVEYSVDEFKYNKNLHIIRCGRTQKFFYFPERFLSLFSLSYQIIKRKKDGYNIIHAHSMLGLLSGKIASVFLRIPLIGTNHGANLLDIQEKTFYYYVEKFILTQVKYNTLISVGSSFKRYKNVNTDIKIIGNGVHLDDFKKVSFRKKDNKIKILFVGRYEWTKGLDILIDAVSRIDRELMKNKKVEFHLIGYGYDEDIYKKKVLDLDISSQVIFRGKITGDSLIKEYKSSDLFVLPSRTEGFGITIIEAMASDLLVVATKCGGPEDIIENGVNGFLIEKENIISLKAFLENFIGGNIEKTESIIKQGKVTVEERYTWENIVEKIYKEYIKLI